MMDFTIDWNGEPLHGMLPTDPLLDTLRGLYRDPKEIDRIFLSPDLTFVEASAPAIGPSDHYPVQMILMRQGILSKKAISSN